jgi:uncharacterized protein with NAD-binding domain and iron-sulfur cluster
VAKRYAKKKARPRTGARSDRRAAKTTNAPKRVGARRRSTETKAAGTDPVPPTAAEPRRRVRVAIIGGGCAGMTAAWYLSQQPGFDMSVYEGSWRLGGKGASGRAPDGRILEHGLHVWLGFYENAFGMIRECYREVETRGWGPHQQDPEQRLAHGSFDEAFCQEPHIGVFGRSSEEDVVWSGLLPPEKGLPGDPIDAETNPFTLASYLLRSVHLLKTLMLSVIAHPTEDVPGGARPESRSALDEVIDLNSSLHPLRSPELLIQSIAGRVRDGTLTVAAAMLQAATILEKVLQDFTHSPLVVDSALRLMKALAAQARKQLRDVVAIDEKLRWKTEIIDIVMTIAVGLYRDRVLLGERGLDALNDLDYREWLLKHGATKTSVKSRFITGIYDLVFAYEKGDRRKPKLAAGVALRGALRMFFSYRGAMFWRMRSGMGDAVFAPLYKVMMTRGVRFHFFHELSGMTLDRTADGRRFVTELRFRAPRNGKRIEHPGSAALDHFGCWPESGRVLLSAVRGSTEPLALRMEQDFDAVIFAAGFDRFAQLVAGDDGSTNGLADPPAAWRTAVATSQQTVATKAAQVWLARDLEALGWFRGSGIVSALGFSFDTWADMTHTLPSERAWRAAIGRSPSAKGDDKAAKAAEARSVAYFCGVLSEEEIKRNQHTEEALRESLAGLFGDMSRLWPRLSRGVPVLARHVQGNVAGSDRYSLSLPGTIRDRLSPLDPSVLNMTVAGDWTACGLDAGCVEAAVMSGMLAAHALTGKEPALDAIVGYDHP